MSGWLTAAAREEPHRVAWVDAQGEISFATLAARAARGTTPERSGRWCVWMEPAECDVASLLALYAALERGAPVALLPARLAPEALTHLQRQLEQHQPPVPAAIAIPTSGSSTGRPRWAVTTPVALAAAAACSAARLGWREHDRWGLRLSPARIAGLTILIRCLLARRAVVRIEHDTPAAQRAVCAARGVTLISLVPTQLHDWLTTPGPIGWSGLRGVVVGGAALSPALHRRALDAGLPVLPSYGMTETGAMITLVDPAQPLSPDQGAGSALPGCQLRIEPDGRVAVRTPGLMHGYLGDAVLAATPDRFFVTSDLARLDERGNLHLHGRADGVLIAMGEKVVPEQVEALLETVPGIRAALVFGVPDPRRGALVCAALVGEPLSDQALLAAFAARLGAASRPRAVIWVDALPRLADGKLDRQAAPAAWRDAVHTLGAG